jgi:hypothetical protein
MPYEVDVIADSISPSGARITTFQLRFPRFLLAQFNTHRAISRSARSSRAVPVARMLDEVETDPVIPACWGTNARGMQAKGELSTVDKADALRAWLDYRDQAVFHARVLVDDGVHKQVVNRMLELWMWADVVATATEWANFFALRCHEDAQPEMQKLAVMMARAFVASVPTSLEIGWWHLPYATADELADVDIVRRSIDHSDFDAVMNRVIHSSVARCARVSYRPFSGDPDPEDDARLAGQLRESGHWGPFEHQAIATHPDCESGNFKGWLQHRQLLHRSVHKHVDLAAILKRYEGRDYIV